MTYKNHPYFYFDNVLLLPPKPCLTQLIRNSFRNAPFHQLKEYLTAKHLPMFLTAAL